MSASDETFCAAFSRDHGEPMVGTASKDGLTWVLLGYDGPWAADPLPSSEVPESAKASLREVLGTVPRTRLAFVRENKPSARPFVILARTDPSSRFLVRFDLDGYEDLVTLPLTDVLRSGSHPRARRVEGPLMLVCTHGKRDRCCALRGVAVYQEALRVAPGHVLQSSHLGGHRFASVVVTLPDGMSYGRIEPNEVAPLFQSARSNRIFDLGKLRGRAGLDEPLQAAEVFVRRDLGLHDVDAVTAYDVEKSAEGARVSLVVEGAKKHVVVYREELPFLRPGSCGDDPTPAYTLRMRESAA